MVSATELPIDIKASAMEMAQAIFGDGVSVVGASYSGDRRSSGIYSEGDSVSPDVTPADTGVILSTGHAEDFTNSWWQANQSANTSTDTRGENGNDAFDDLVGAATYDASMLTVDFIPETDTMTMQFVFASEEYPEYTGTIYNDAVGVWINGVPATLTVGDGSTSVGNINDINNINLYRDNTDDAYNTEMDGFTVTMTLTIPVNAGTVNTLTIGIADVADSGYDSSILIAGDSIQTALVAQEDEIRIDPNDLGTLDVLSNDSAGPGATLTVTHINGVAVSVGSTVMLPNGIEVTLNADGTFGVQTDGDEETSNFTYTVDDGLGHTDTGMVTVHAVPCFVAGTLIGTPGGEVPVETLQPGDLVTTQDNGPQPLRWIGRRLVRARGDLAPVRIAADTFGRHRALRVSPQHRVVIRDALSELLFGEAEVLVPAKHLVNGRSVVQEQGGFAEYVHLLFDTHQVVFSEGLATESFLPGPQTTGLFEQNVLAEICRIFPELDPETGAGYSPSARRTLRDYEAKVLLAGSLAA